MTMNRLAIVVAALVTACGGGSDDPSTSAVTATNPNAAWAKLMTTERTWVTTGLGSDGATYQITRTLQPRGSAGDPLAQVLSTTTTRRNGVVVPPVVRSNNSESEIEVTYLRADRSVASVARPSLDSLSAVDPGVPPAMASVGDTGPLYQGSWCFACAPASLPVNVVATWQFTVDDGVPYFCVRRTEPVEPASSTTKTVSHCVEVDAAGGILDRAMTQVQVQGGLSLTARN